MKALFIIVPCKNEEKNIQLFYERITTVISEIPKDIPISEWSIIFVDDGSTDSTLYEVKKLKKSSDHIKYISFTKNFGKEAAMLAGLKTAYLLSEDQGGLYAVMDADLQDPPELLKKMLLILYNNKELECVAARRISRTGEPVLRSFGAKLFYRFFNYLSDVKLMDGARDFCIMRREMLKAILGMEEFSRFSKGLFAWTGFRTEWLEYENQFRKEGNSGWSLFKLIAYAVDGIVSFSPKPLELSAILGVLSCICSGFMIFYFILQKITAGIDVPGYALLVCLILLMGGMQLLCIGIVGEYISKIFMETKKRPLYFIRESEGFEKLL